MKYSLLILLAYAVAGFGQPVEGPWVVVEGDTNLNSPHVAAMANGQMNLLCVQNSPDSDRVNLLTVDIQTHVLTDTVQTAAYLHHWTTRLTDVEIDEEGRWIAAMDHSWGGPREEIYLVLSDGASIYSYFVDEASYWINGSCNVFEWFQEFGVTSRTSGWSWSVGAGHTNPFECFPVVTAYAGLTSYDTLTGYQPFYDYQSLAGSPTHIAVTWSALDSVVMLMTSNHFENSPSGTLLFSASAPPIHLDSVLASIYARYNASGDLLVVSGISSSYSAPTIVNVDSVGGCHERSVIPWIASPTDVAWQSNFGFAVLQQSANALRLFRADTEGEMYIDDDLFYSPDISHRIVSADVQISAEGTICVLWKENTLSAPFQTSVKLMRFGWDTPLSAPPSDFTPYPSSFSLSAYPNPFNSELQIQYDLPRAQTIELAVYNLLGQQVAELEHGIKTAGTHQAIWSAHEGSGIYFVSLRTGETTKTQKVLLAR